MPLFFSSIGRHAALPALSRASTGEGGGEGGLQGASSPSAPPAKYHRGRRVVAGRHGRNLAVPLRPPLPVRAVRRRRSRLAE